MRSEKFAPHVNVGNHAVVVGGSIAGLLSARVLADSFASVTIIEVAHLLTSPLALYHPKVVFRVLGSSHDLRLDKVKEV